MPLPGPVKYPAEPKPFQVTFPTTLNLHPKQHPPQLNHRQTLMSPVQEEASSKVKNVNAEPLSDLAGRKETVTRSLLVCYYIVARIIPRVCAPQSRLVLRRPAGRRPEWLRLLGLSRRVLHSRLLGPASRRPPTLAAGRRGVTKWNRVRFRCDWKFSRNGLSFLYTLNESSGT